LWVFIAGGLQHLDQRAIKSFALSVRLRVEGGRPGFFDPRQLAQLMKELPLEVLSAIGMQLARQSEQGEKPIVHGAHTG